MWEFILEYGPTVLAGLGAVGSFGGAIYSLSKVFKIGKKVDNNYASTQKEIEITREGVVEAFKAAKIPTEWKISVSTQVKELLTEFKNNFMAEYEKKEAAKDEIILMLLNIMAKTAAAGKLTTDEKSRLYELLNTISEKDATIDITEKA